MRTELKKIGESERHQFVGTFVRYGIKNGYKGPIKTLLLKDVCDTEGNLITEHLWFTCTKGFDKYKFVEGDVISFFARVKKYIKGYKGFREDVFDCPIEEDYKLSYPTKITKIENKQS